MKVFKALASATVTVALMVCAAGPQVLALASRDAGTIVVDGKTFSSAKNCKGDNWKYDAKSHTLSLDGYTGMYIDLSQQENAVIELSGENKVTSNVEAPAIQVEGNLTIQGEGSLKLEVTACHSAVYAKGGDYTIYEYNEKTGKLVKTGTLKSNKIDSIVKANNVTLDFMVQYTRNGKVSAEIDSYKVSVKIYYKPALRLTTGLDPSDGKSFIRLRWDRVEGTEAYRVYRYVNGKLRFVTELGPDRPTLKISGTKPGKTYTYAAKALVNGEWTKADSADLASIGSK